MNRKLFIFYVYMLQSISIYMIVNGMANKKNDALKTYHSKRKFNETTEPKGRVEKKNKEPIFVVQLHDASHLHYDVRLEIEGVLISWAVPKGISTDPKEKHLAIMTEPHPMDYAHFEGIIPVGNYGAGTVMVWDIGTYKNLKKTSMSENVDKGKIEIEFFGTKLKGSYALVRTQLHNDKKNWLLFKMKENLRVPGIKTKNKSALTNRTLPEIAQDKKARVWNSKKV